MNTITENKIVLPTLRGVIGDWVFYSTLMSAKQIGLLIQPAKDIRETKKLDEILQRDLKDRKKAIAKYLLTNESHFFNSIIAGVFDEVPDWIEFKFKANADYNLSDDQLLSLKQSMGFLVFSGNEKIFAIDGQHRVAGIQIANENKNKKAIEVLVEDQFSVIFVAHIDDAKGRKRTRKLFSDINKNAKPVAAGDKIKIDEEDLCSIVTRRVYANNPFFIGGSIISLTESSKLEQNDTNNFTNLLGLYTTNKVLQTLFKNKKNIPIWDEENVIPFLEIITKFYEFAFNNINDYKQYFIDKTLTIEEARVNNKYLLFRPIGLKLIASLYVYFVKADSLDFFKNNINKISFIFPHSQFDKLLWNNGKMEAKTINQTLALDLSLYLLHQQVDFENLLTRYRQILKNDDAILPAKVILD